MDGKLLVMARDVASLGGIGKDLRRHSEFDEIEVRSKAPLRSWMSVRFTIAMTTWLSPVRSITRVRHLAAAAERVETSGGLCGCEKIHVTSLD